MNYKTYLKTWEGLQAETKWSRIIIAGLLLLCLIFVVLVARKETIVTMKPFTLVEDAWVSSSEGSQSYQEAWGLALAQLIGNVTPGTVDFVKDRLEPLLAPVIYQDVVSVLTVQAEQIKKDRVSMRFEPRSVDYETETGKVFVYGYSYLEGTGGAPKRTDRTYEFEIEISNYAPSIVDLETYADRPRTKKYLSEIQRRKESRSSNE